MIGCVIGSVRWIAAPEEAVRADGPVAWLLRWDDPRVEGWLARAPPDVADLARFAERADAALRIARRRLARLLLAEASGHHPGAVRLVDGAQGAAAVAAPAGWHLSLAGRDSWCAIAIGRLPLGIDIEAIAGAPVPRDLLTPGERRWLGLLPEPEVLRVSITCWTAKEAHAKRLGHPRALDPAIIDVRIDKRTGEARSAGAVSRLDIWDREALVAVVATPSPRSATEQGAEP